MSVRAYLDKHVGHRVLIIGPGHYHGKYIGMEGEIRAVWSIDNLAVAIDGKRNPASGHGYFYFKFSELEILNKNTKTATAAEKGESKMQKMENYLNVAVVQFLNDRDPFRTYEYANYTPDLAVGDLCAVASAHHGLGLAEIVEIKDHASEDLFREIVAKVDTSSYDNRVERRKKAAELRAQMRERAKQLQDIVLYQTLAERDPSMAQMLQEYLALNK